MKSTQALFAAVLTLAAVPSFAADPKNPAAEAAMTDIKKTLGFVPNFLKAVPEIALPGVWQEMKELQMSNTTALTPKYKELIGLAVASQIPCKYCILAHTEFAKVNGATKEELGIAVAEAGVTRYFSTYVNGSQTDPVKFSADLKGAIGAMKKMDPNAAPPKPMAVTDTASAYRDIEQYYGMVPEFLKDLPPAALPGAWKQMRDVEVLSAGVIAPKMVSLISLGVSSQIPCKYCIEADTEFARAQGATDAELKEAIAIAAHTRNMSTLLNGVQMDEAAFKADIAKLTKPKGKTVAAVP